MNRINDALALLNKIINEDEMNNANSNLFVLRARLNFKENNVRKYIIYGRLFLTI